MKRLLSLCLCLLLLLAHGTTWAGTVQVTAEDLTRLDQIFSELRSNNELLMQDSTKSALDLIEVSRQLKQSQLELLELKQLLIRLQAESIAAKSESKQAQDLLTKVNADLTIYGAEQKTIQRRLKTERTIWQILFIAAAGYAVIK